METCRECSGALICTETEYVCCVCGLVSQMPILLPGIEEVFSEIKDPVCSVVEYMVYSLGFEEAKVDEVNIVYAEYCRQLHKKKVFNKMEIICAVILSTTKDSFFDEYCNHFELNSTEVGKHLSKLRGSVNKCSRTQAIFDIVVEYCEEFNVQLCEIPEITVAMCDLPFGEKFIAGALICHYGKVLPKNMIRKTMSSTSLYKCLAALRALPTL